MRLSKFLITTLTITLLAILYVYQQSKIFQMAYEVQKKLAFLEYRLDENKNLKYLINRQISLVSIGSVWQKGDFEWPHQEQLVSLSNIKRVARDSEQIKETGNIFTYLFGLKSQAEATSIKSR